MNKPPFVMKRARSRGFTLVEVLVALALTALMIGGVATMINSSLEDTRGQQAALYQQLVSGAAKQVVQQNFADLSSKATAGSPVVVGFTGGSTSYHLSDFLPPNTTPTNPYGQTPCLLVYSDSSGMLNGLLVTEGGMTIPDPELGYIAANSGQGAGSIPATNNGAGAAIGAFGEWTRKPANPAGSSCSGSKTGVGHLATEVYYNGNQVQNTDYLYRVSVPGNAQANTMQVPIVLAQQTDYALCSNLGAVAADQYGNVVNCQGTSTAGVAIWAPEALRWRGAVPDEASLGPLFGTQPGDVAVTLKTNRAYTYNGSTWQALAVDEDGYLNLGNTHNINDACPTTPASNTAVTTDSQGRVLSCQNGTLQDQAAIDVDQNNSNCVLLMAQAGATDYSCQQAGSLSFDKPTNTYSYLTTAKMTFTKSGVINVSAWEHMNDATYGQTYTSGAEIAQYIYVLDGNGNQLAENESQSPILINDSMGINNSLSFPAAAGTYTVQVKSSFAHFEPPGTGTNPLPLPWASNYEGGSGVVINTPVAAGWTISTYY